MSKLLNLLPFTFILERVWSKNRWYPKCSTIRYRVPNLRAYYYTGHTNSYGRYTYRLKPRFIKKSILNQENVYK